MRRCSDNHISPEAVSFWGVRLFCHSVSRLLPWLRWSIGRLIDRALALLCSCSCLFSFTVFADSPQPIAPRLQWFIPSAAMNRAIDCEVSALPCYLNRVAQASSRSYYPGRAIILPGVFVSAETGDAAEIVLRVSHFPALPSRPHCLVNKFQPAIPRHPVRQLSRAAEVVAEINFSNRIGFIVSDIDGPHRNFVAFVINVGLRAVAKDAAPFFFTDLVRCCHAHTIPNRLGYAREIAWKKCLCFPIGLNRCKHA